MQVVATGISFAYPGAGPLYENLSFTGEEGDLVALTGPSGSGKSTLLSLLGGWLTPTAGTMEIVGAGKRALVSQNPHGVPGRSTLDHVSLPLVAKGLSRSEAVSEALEYLALVNLERVADRPYRMLSGGERQRMLLARGLASKPGMLLVDEPTAQLDAASAVEVCSVLSGLGISGVLIFVATHDHRVIKACSRVVDLLDVVSLEIPSTHPVQLGRVHSSTATGTTSHASSAQRHAFGTRDGNQIPHGGHKP